MSERLVVNLDELHTALGHVLSAVKARLGDEVVLDHDYYWHLPVESAFDMIREPENLTVGRISDDLSAASSSTRPEPLTAWHELAHLIGLLRAVEIQSRA